MDLARIADSIRDGFYRWGWLLPAWLPLAQVGGRGAFNTLSGLYFLWALLSLRPGPVDRRNLAFFALYGLMLGLWALSLTQATDPQKGGYELLRFAQLSLTGLFTVMVLRDAPGRFRHLADAMAWGALAVIVALYLQLPYYLFVLDFDPTQQLREDNLPWLLPFLLLAVSSGPRARRLAAAAITAFAVYIALSQGRAALLALLAALGVFAVLGFRVRTRYLLATGAALLALGIVLGQRFFRGVFSFGLDFDTLDRFTSGRATIWWRAIHTPPDNPWLGVGLGNVSDHVDVLRVGEETVKHLHNFVLDAWFETGLLGLTALLALIGGVLVRAYRAWPALDETHRRIAAAALAGIAALLTAGLFSFSYTSRQFAVYLFVMFAIVLALPRGQGR